MHLITIFDIEAQQLRNLAFTKSSDCVYWYLKAIKNQRSPLRH